MISDQNMINDILPPILVYIETYNKSCIIIDECTVENERTEIKRNSKNLFVCTCIVLDLDINLEKRDQNLILEVLLDTEIRVWNTFFAKSKIFRLHAILHDSAGSVKSTAKKRTGVLLCCT